MTDVTYGKVLSLCNACAHATDHGIAWQDTYELIGTNGKAVTLIQAVHCLGCKQPAIRREHRFIDGDGTDRLLEVRYEPPRTWRRKPDWIDQLEPVAPDLMDLLHEVYSAIHDQQSRLLSMGVRAALDHVMSLMLGGDVGSFDKKLDAMVARGHITAKQRENLDVVIDAGSASSHRGYRPPRELVEEMVVVMENVIRDHFITGPMLATAKTLIPPRPRVVQAVVPVTQGSAAAAPAAGPNPGGGSGIAGTTRP